MPEENHSHSSHGGVLFDSSASERMSSSGKQTWTVHDGKFFADAIWSNKPQAPQERRFLELSRYEDIFPPDTQGCRQMKTWTGLSRSSQVGLSFKAGDRRSVREAEFLSATKDPKPPKARARATSGTVEAWLPRILSPVSLQTLQATMHSIRTYDEFTLGHVIGRGQFAFIRQAMEADGTKRALKVSLAPIGKSGEAAGASHSDAFSDEIDCFLREGCMLAELSHPFIVRSRGTGRIAAEGGIEYGFLVLDVIEGRDLRAHMTRGLEMATVIRWSAQLAEALAFLHGRRIIHRDVKSSNIMIITSSHDVKLIDFGLALQFSSVHEDSSVAAPPILTDYQADRRVGVFGYMPPEVYNCQPYGPPVDTFAYGVVLSQLLRAAHPLAFTASMRVSMRHLLWDVFQLGYVANMCTPAVPTKAGRVLSSLLYSCMAIDPARRPSMQEVLAQLQLGATEFEIPWPAEALEAAHAPPPPPRRHGI